MKYHFIIICKHPKVRLAGPVFKWRGVDVYVVVSDGAGKKRTIERGRFALNIIVSDGCDAGIRIGIGTANTKLVACHVILFNQDLLPSELSDGDGGIV